MIPLKDTDCCSKQKMIKRIGILALICTFVACTSNTIYEKPENLIPKDQMVDIMTDLLLATGAKNTRNINLERKINYYPLVFEKYNIDSTRFKESNLYYTSRIDDLDYIFSRVEKRLKDLKDLYDRDKALKDSLRLESDGVLPEDFDY